MSVMTKKKKFLPILFKYVHLHTSVCVAVSVFRLACMYRGIPSIIIPHRDAVDSKHAWRQIPGNRRCFRYKKNRPSYLGFYAERGLLASRRSDVTGVIASY